ncbi:Protein of unknown function DUF1680 [Cynara cardunculus var. scolymus]|uniref:Uncharacterized protein n=1 Tax=Cynara cardunculus var. scolymus TaxID=59895 RepID=A0A103Y0E0_CYNCS|nr:Protein of unknown function DUF1680 [Cynara cardunculus var. scolymus]
MEVFMLLKMLAVVLLLLFCDCVEDEYSWMMMYKQMKKLGVRSRVSGNFLNEIPLGDVRLDPDSIHGQAQQTNLEYLLMLDVDSLVWSFRKTAGLPTPATAYGGWESPNQELRGHFVGWCTSIVLLESFGHYLSATAQMWASTNNDTLKEKMTAVVSALAACQEKMDSGYLSAFPTEFFDRFEAIKQVWAPYYTIHKIMAGLVDQYVLAGNSEALKMVTQMADYFRKRVENVITKYTIERHWRSLNEETGGMNDVMYRLYTITGDTKHLWLAHLFDKPCFLGLLAVKADELSGFHANTHIPIVVGSQMRYEITGDPLYKEIGMSFMDIVNSSHMYASGGTSVSRIESFSKLGDSIYFEEAGKNPGVYIIQYISSSLNWKSGQILLEQKVIPVASWDPRLRVTITIASKKEGSSSTLNFRIPFWTTSNAKATLNGQGIPITSADDRSDYASLHAILYGPYLLVGLTTGDCDLKAESGSLSNWITPIPSDYNSHLISLSQETGNSTFALSHTNTIVTMAKFSNPGTSDSVFSTFRIILADSSTSAGISSYKDAIGKTIKLEPYNLPGMSLVALGKEIRIGISDSLDPKNSLFRLVDGNEGTVRLESESQKGCFVYSSDGSVKLSCDSGGSDSGFMTSTSFKANNGISQYHPISFVAKGLNMNFVLQPLFSLRDEQYAVYFKLHS